MPSYSEFWAKSHHCNNPWRCCRLGLSAYQSLKEILNKFLDKKGVVIPVLKDNLPGDEMVNKFFDNITPALLESTGGHIYNYNKTNITDDPGARKVIVSRNFKRVKRVQNFSRRAISISWAELHVVNFCHPWLFMRPPNFMKIDVSVGILGLSIKIAQAESSMPISLRSSFSDTHSTD